MARQLETIALTTLLLVASMSSAQGNGKNASSSQQQSQSSSASNSNAPFESQMLAFGALDQIARSIALRTCKQVPIGSIVTVYDQNSFASLQAYQAFNANALALLDAYQSLLPATDTSIRSFSAGPGGVDLMADITNAIAAVAIATNTNTGSSITIQDNSLALNIMKYLSAAPCSEKQITAIYPPLSTFAPKSQLPEVLELVTRMKRHVQDEIDAKVIKGEQQIKVFAEVNTLYDAFVSSLISINSTTGQPGMFPIAQGAGLYAVLRNANAKVLYANVATAGGTQRNKKNLLTSLTTGDWITYSGGVAVNTQLIDSKTGKIYFSDVLRYRTPTTHVKSPSNKNDTSQGDNLGEFCANNEICK
jgi:hypothetical protein